MFHIRRGCRGVVGQQAALFGFPKPIRETDEADHLAFVSTAFGLCASYFFLILRGHPMGAQVSRWFRGGRRAKDVEESARRVSGTKSFPGWHPLLAPLVRLVRNAACPMALMVGPNGTPIANSAMCAVFREDPEGDVTPRSPFELLPEYGDVIADVLIRAQRGHSSSFRNQAITCKGNAGARTKWFNLDFTPVTDEAGAYLAVLCTGSEVAHQVPAAAKGATLEENRIQFQALTETLPQIVWSCGADGEHDYFSERWSEFTGIPPEKITAETWKQLVYPPHWSQVSQVWENARQTGEPYDIDYRFRHHTGEYRWLRVMALPIRDEAGQITRWCGTSTDVHETYLVAEERQKLARELERIATQDQLTEVLTRRAFLERSTNAVNEGGNATSLLMMDIDHFKRINDTYGHPGGDAVLSVAAKRVRTAVQEEDLVGRLGGEEFAVLLPDCDAQEASRVAERIRSAIETEPFAVGADLIQVTISIGVTTAVGPDSEIEQLLLIADKALYEAKSSGRNRWVFMPSARGVAAA